MKRLILILLMTAPVYFCIPANAQEAAAGSFKGKEMVPIRLQYFHDLITQQQNRATRLDGTVDDKITIPDDEKASTEATDAIIRQVNEMRQQVENSPDIEFRKKIYYLTCISTMLANFNGSWQHGKIDPALAPVLVKNFRAMMRDDIAGKSIAGEVAEVPYEVAEINVRAFKDNYGSRVARSIIFREYAKAHPENVLRKLSTDYSDFINDPFTDTIVAAIAKKYTIEVYNYATSFTALGNVIRKNPDPLVQAIVKAGQSNAAVRILPYVEYIVNGTYTVADLEKIAADDDKYYKLSVKSMIDMERRQLAGESPIGIKAMRENIYTRALKYIRQVNDLHESPDPVRFASLDGFTPQELYYLVINGQEELYTSSYVGIFKRLMQRMKPPRGDEFLVSVIFDHFRKFLTMAAAYNTLDTFLKSMSPGNSRLLMQKFIADLETKPTLEDAVDVADAFASIKDSALAKFLQGEVDNNFIRVSGEGNERGKVIYGLLRSLFNGRESSSKDSVWSEDISRKLNLPPIDFVPYKNLVSADGKVYQEVFFYADKDGFDSYHSFMSSFSGPTWKLEKLNKYYMSISSTKGKPTVLYVKLPMSTPEDDDAGQDALTKYLDAHDIHPTIFIHRGHSYHVTATIEQLQSSAKVVMLGSCGGYNSLAGVLDVSPDAQIISSKQTGSMFVNEPIIRAIEENIREGKDLNWINIWSKLGKEFKGNSRYNELFEDYIPPQKNLGAIFIKAYRKLMKEKGKDTDSDG